MFDFSLADFAARAPAILIGLALHEYAHAKAASMLGDPTPRWEGRLTLNPLPHLDFLGTLMLVFGPIGWAKPVNVNPNNFRGDRKRGMMLVALAGPAMNLLVALIAAILVYGLWGISELNIILRNLVIINLYLAVFNILPIPPLDGSKVLMGLLPYKHLGWMYSLEQYGPIILLLAVVTGVASKITYPVFYALYVGFINPVASFIARAIF